MEWKTFGDPELEKIAIQCRAWGLSLKTNARPRWLSIIGDSDTGKTYACEKMWNWAKIQFDWKNFSFLQQKIYWPDFVQCLRAGKHYEFRDELKRWPVLFLDDIGAERDSTGFASEELNTLLGCRVGKWTLITSNLDIDGLTAIDRRISSRLIRDENTCVSVKTKEFSTR